MIPLIWIFISLLIISTVPFILIMTAITGKVKYAWKLFTLVWYIIVHQNMIRKILTNDYNMSRNDAVKFMRNIGMTNFVTIYVVISESLAKLNGHKMDEAMKILKNKHNLIVKYVITKIMSRTENLNASQYK